MGQQMRICILMHLVIKGLSQNVLNNVIQLQLSIFSFGGWGGEVQSFIFLTAIDLSGLEGVRWMCCEIQVYAVQFYFPNNRGYSFE